MIVPFSILAPESEEAAGGGGGGGGSSIPAPFYNPGPGTYGHHPAALSVTIATTKTGATLRYTTNNVDPTISTGTPINSTSGSATLPRNSFTVLKSITVYSGQVSAVTTGNYSVEDD